MGLDRPKQFAPLAGVPILRRTVAIFMGMCDIDQVVVALPEEWFNEGKKVLAGFDSRLDLVIGGVTRQDSVAAGLACLKDGVEVVAVHDGARPLVDPVIIRACLAAAARDGAALVAVSVKDTLKAVAGEKVAATVDRAGLWQAQTPQAARRELLEQAFAAAAKEGFVATDEAGLFEHAGIPVAVVEGSDRNLKITRPEDLAIAGALLNGDRTMRIGHGFDAHRLADGLRLVLGGVEIPWEKGLVGHSDADVLTHAVCDAILGAIAAGDIGRHFPDSDPAYKGVSSLKLLAEVVALAGKGGARVANLDVTVVAQAPKLFPHIEKMRENLARVIGVAVEQINVKATTTESMGYCGRGEGIAAHAVVMISGASQRG